METDAIEKLLVLGVRELLDICRGRFSLTRDERRTQRTIIEAIISRASPQFLDAVQRFAQSQQDKGDLDIRTRKRKREAQTGRRVARRLEERPLPNWEEVSDVSRYMALPNEEERKSCYRAFFDGTGSDAVKFATCGVCAREVGVKHDRLMILPLNQLPNGHRLFPKCPHPSHDLYEGMLLESSGVLLEATIPKVQICHGCLDDLKKFSNNPPKFSLANGLWIGKVPWCLQVLTFPEQLLLARIFPRVYVFKLFPKVGVGQDPDVLQRGMRGTVSSFELDNAGIASMVSGNMLPHPPAILASIISVTFIGLKSIPKSWLKSTFRVRRSFVAAALRWFKDHNPTYYGSIEIDAQRIADLPEDDVPVEISGVVRHSTDTGVMDQEGEGYVDVHEDTASERTAEVVDGSTCNDVDAADVIPLQMSGTIDTDMSKVSANEMMMWALSNLWKEGNEGGYLVRHGHNPVRDFGGGADGSNFFEQAFPCLFPYGVGGIEREREVKVDFLEHVRWALQYHDRRFRKHENFPFVAFGISQRRQALASARVQMRRKNFDKDIRLMTAVTLEGLEQAKLEESRNHPISDPGVRLLRQHMHATIGRVMGSDQSRYQLRSQIWSTSVVLGPPTLWVTINPTDLHDPIAQVIAGEDIDLDSFSADVGPDTTMRARNIAADPYAAAKFFHFIVGMILESLFGIRVTDFQIHSEMGILGRVGAYFGTVESQGRGTLHLHLLIWLKDTPNPDEMVRLLKSEDFRARIVTYIGINLRAYLPGLESAASVHDIPVKKDIAYNRPPDPNSPDYDNELRQFELQLARSEQVHTCRVRRCLVPDRNGNVRCKRHAPFQCSDEDFVDENGNWGLKRLFGYMNGWNPGVLVNGRCNNDMKLLTNGKDTRNITFYTTVYSAKKQNRYDNISAIMAKGYAYHLDHLSIGPESEYVDGLRDAHRLLIFRLVNAINREQELAAPMVISYLMGWGDTYRSHHYTPIYWSTFVGGLLESYPDLKHSSMIDDGVMKTDQRGNGEESIKSFSNHTEDPSDQDSKINQRGDGEEGIKPSSNHTEGPSNLDSKISTDEIVTLDLDSMGKLYGKSQLTDYCARGHQLETYNVLEFFVNTYEGDLQERGNVGVQPMDHPNGRRLNDRIPYLPCHPKHRTAQRVLRSSGHHNLPNFIGPWFPNRNDVDQYEFYCGAMLMLLKPWRILARDLKIDGQTWAEYPCWSTVFP